MKTLLMILLFPLSIFSATVNLAWDRQPDPGVAGYNIYRSTMSGGPYTKLNLNLIPQTTVDSPMYTDMTPSNVQTFYYVVTAVSVGMAESGFSNQVTVNSPPTAPTNLRVVSFSAINLLVDKVQVATGPVPTLRYILQRQTPPRDREIIISLVP